VGAAHKRAGTAPHAHHDADHHDHPTDGDDIADGHQRPDAQRNSDERNFDERTHLADDHDARAAGRAAVGRPGPRPNSAAVALTVTLSSPRYTGVP
jgi:hypothetical protein